GCSTDFSLAIFQIFGDAVLLKGGLVLELRLERARATKDVDLRLVGSPDALLAGLQQAGQRDLGDFCDSREPVYSVLGSFRYWLAWPATQRAIGLPSLRAARPSVVY